MNETSIESRFVLDGQSGCGIILLTVCFFQALQQLTSIFPLPSSVRSTDDAFREFRWRNLIISWLHACITGIWSLSCLVSYRQMYEDMILFKNWPCFGVCCFSTGYFIYDTLDIVKARRIREKWEILIHHGAIIVCALYVVSTAHCVGYHTLAMVIEVNTAFLHFRKLLQMAAVSRHHLAVQLNVSVNLITFLVFRFAPLSYLSFAVYRDGERVPFWFLTLFSTCMTTLNIINVILFYRLIKTDVCHIRSRHRGLPQDLCASLNMEDEFGSPSHSRQASNAKILGDDETLGQNGTVVGAGDFRRRRGGGNILKDVTKIGESVQRTLAAPIQ